MTVETTQRRALIVTGEASGDLHGANLIRAARESDPELAFFGVGGSRMAAAGCDILIPGEELAVMGLVEVLGHFPVIWRAFQQLKRILYGPERPDLLVLIDFPEFNLRLAAQAKKAGIPVLYYVSPQVWAWRRGRVKKIARVVDRLAAIFPFEPALYEGLDIQVEYVGNPLTDEAIPSRSREDFLVGVGLDPARTVVGVFPGSRVNELKYNFETMLQAAQLLHRQRPGLQFLLPVAAGLDPALLQEWLRPYPLPLILVNDNIYDVAQACDGIMTVSGTVTLQTALVGTPMAILYRLSPLSYAIGKRLIKVPHIGLANIVAGRAVVREFIQDQATPKALAEELLRMLEDETYRNQVKEGLKLVRQHIGPPGCSRRVAAMASAMSRGGAGGGPAR